MKRINYYAIVTVAIAITMGFASCTEENDVVIDPTPEVVDPSVPEPEPEPVETLREQLSMPEPMMAFPKAAADGNEMVETLNEFGFNFIRAVMQNRDDVFDKSDAYINGKNLAVSPISAALCMAMMSNSLDSVSSARFNEILGAPSTETLNEAVGKILAKQQDKYYQFELLNNVWVHDTVAVSQSYPALMSDVFGAGVESIDIRCQAGIDKVNDWCNEKSHGMIPQILNAVDEVAIAYLLQVMYFNSEWDVEMEEVGEQLFHGLSGDSSAPFMYMRQTRSQEVSKSDKCTIVKLKLCNWAYSLMLILPAEGYTPEGILADLTLDEWKAMKQENQGAYELELTMPMFSFSSNNALQKATEWLGIPWKGYYDGISGHMNQWTQLYLLQNVAIDVNNHGVACAAATLGGMASDPGFPQESMQIRIDSPFAFILEEEMPYGSEDNGIILAAGIFNNPL